MSYTKNDAQPIPRLTIYGLVHKNLKNQLQEYFSTFDFFFSQSFSPVWELVIDNPIKTYSRVSTFLRKVKAFLILGSRNISLLFSTDYLKIKLEMDYSLSEISKLSEKFEELIGSENFYASRNLGVLGYQHRKIDLSLDYDLQRRTSQYKLFLTTGKISSGTNVFKSELLSNNFVLKNLGKKEISIINQTYLPIAFAADQPDYQQSKLGLNSKLTTSGNLARLSSSNPHEIQMNTRWGYRLFENAEVMHGQIIKSRNEFHLSDPKRHSFWGENMNLIPGIIFQSRNLEWHTPKPINILEVIPEAIFIGGTNNLMHTVLEDLPRLIFSDRMRIRPDVPLLISNQLSPQIVELIQRVSSRLCIQLGLYSSLTVRNLHFFQFDSPLPEVMGGDSSLSEDLFSNSIAESITGKIHTNLQSSLIGGNRILILREPGLFRPLTNKSQIKELLQNIFDFKPIYLSNLDYSSVHKIFGSASIVIGEYGAALANAIHMQPGSSLLEIRGPLESRASEYEILIKSLKLKHSLLIGESRPISRYGISKGPYSVPIDILREKVTELIREAS